MVWEVLSDIMVLFLAWPIKLAIALDKSYAYAGIVVAVIWWGYIAWAFTGGYSVKKTKKK